MALLEGTNVAGLVMVAYPDASKVEAELATMWITALFAIDDKVDAYSINKSEWDEKYKKPHTEEETVFNSSIYKTTLEELNSKDDIFDSLDESILVYKYLESLDHESEPEKFNNLVQGIKHGFQDIGYKNIEETHNNLYSGEIEFELRSVSSIRDGQVHGLYDHQS